MTQRKVTVGPEHEGRLVRVADDFYHHAGEVGTLIRLDTEFVALVRFEDGTTTWVRTVRLSADEAPRSIYRPKEV